jgi:hypothetical protein
MTVSEIVRTDLAQRLSHRRRRIGMVAVLGFALVIGGLSTGARAADDDEEGVLPDTKILRHILKGLGLKRDGEAIEYRERSPLVLPPDSDLPPPESAKQNARTAAWPNDPDVRRAKQRKEDSKKFVREDEDGARPLLPSQYNLPNPGRRKDGGVPGKSAEEAAAPSTLQELGAKNIFSKVFAPSEEYGTFTGEPQRGSLTEPPAGYRTPSPNQPYGIGKEKWKPSAEDRAAQDVR